jgi:enterochelin esterase-like enzyme
MAFGVAAVNKFYGYYETWGGMVSDLTGQGTANIPSYQAAGGVKNRIGHVTTTGEDAEVGYLFQTTITGKSSHLTRDVYVYLPPQYFQKAYAHYRFPVIELLHGSPGSPQAWVDVMDVIPTFLNLLEGHPGDAAVLVMPNSDGGPQYELQCLNDPGGIQDMTFVARDVPDAIARIARVQPPGRAWGVAGYSEGGYCAANIGLQELHYFGATGVMSGYFTPIVSQVPEGNKPGGRPHQVNVFRGRPALRLLNSPLDYVSQIPITSSLPAFWLAAGVGAPGDVDAARQFRQVLETRVADVPLMLIPGGHQGSVWRAALAPMLRWMTPQLAAKAVKADAEAAHAAAVRKARERAAKIHPAHAPRPAKKNP